MAKKSLTKAHDPTHGQRPMGQAGIDEDIAICVMALLTMVGLLLADDDFDKKSAATDCQLLADGLRARLPDYFQSPKDKE